MNIAEVSQLEYFIHHQLRHGSDPLDECEALLELCESGDAFDQEKYRDAQECAAHKQNLENGGRDDKMVPVLVWRIVDPDVCG